MQSNRYAGAQRHYGIRKQAAQHCGGKLSREAAAHASVPKAKPEEKTETGQKTGIRQTSTLSAAVPDGEADGVLLNMRTAEEEKARYTLSGSTYLNEMLPLVSDFPHVFVICAYGESPYLESCIQSVLTQKQNLRKGRGKRRMPVLLCTSTPNAHIEELAERYRLPLFVRRGQSSLRADWNFGIEMAKIWAGAQLVTIAHQDDVYHPDYRARLFSAWKKYGNKLSVFCAHYRSINAKGEKIRGKTETVKRILRLPLHIFFLRRRKAGKRLALRFGNSIGCPTCTYNLLRTGLPLFQKNYQFALDWDTLWRLAGQDGYFICSERALMDYRIHDGAATKANIVNHNREGEETALFSQMWPGPVVRILMHFYKKAYTAYEQPGEARTGKKAARTK